MENAPIGDYALIGDSRSAALVSRDGSIDWLCLPRFDSPSVFSRLLDIESGGYFQVRPSSAFEVERRYVPWTNVLETTFRAPTGSFVLRDLFPVQSEQQAKHRLLPEHQVLREIEGLAGDTEVQVLYEPRPNYAQSVPKLQDRGKLGVWCEWGGAAFTVRSDIPLFLTDGDGSAHGTARIRAGEHWYVSLVFNRGPAVVPPLGEVARAKVEETIGWWEAWSGKFTYQGQYQDAVFRSALALKLLAYAPSGAVIAAPTTSLPELLGGVRNWDYRYCWLRDASLTIRALFALGCSEEAEAFLGWMLHATRLTWPELQVVYDVHGESRLTERELEHLQGYAGSRPVRVGNDAHSQLQLDVYGEVMDAVAQFAAVGGRFDRDTARMLDGLGRTVCDRWREPDDGIWEARSGRQHHTYSKAMCWVALDRLIRMHEAGQIKVNVDRFRAERDAIRAEVETRGYNAQLQSYTRVLDGDDLDASLLLLPVYGYVDATDPRMRSTCERIRENLGRGGLVYRYSPSTQDGLPAGEGAFGISSFWAVECMAMAGNLEAATAAFDHLLTFANDVGLYGEEIEPETGGALGNFPQAFTHIGLINAALALSKVRKTGDRE